MEKIEKPTDREITRRREDQDRYLPKVERFFRLPVNATFTTASTDLEIPHNVGKVPTDVIPAAPSADVRIWKGDTDWTAEYIYLQASAACSVTLYLVV